MTSPLTVPSPAQMLPWNLAQLIVTLGAFPISRGAGASGYGPDVVLTIKQPKKDVINVEGADGTVTTCMTNSVLTEFELTVLQSNSPTSGYLSTIRIAQKAAGAVLALPLVIQDLNGTTYFQSNQTWVMGPPDQEFKVEAGPRVWSLSAISVVNFLGGN
jgi:hypothetical protein